MTVTLEQRANQLIQHLNSATDHLVKNEPNRTRKRISNFLLYSRRFLRESEGNWSWDRILLTCQAKPNPELSIRALNIFLEKTGKHKRRNDLAKSLVHYFENFNKTKEKNAASPRDAGKVFKISRNTPSRKSSKALMADWVSINAVNDNYQPEIGTPKPHHDHHSHHHNPQHHQPNSSCDDHRKHEAVYSYRNPSPPKSYGHDHQASHYTPSYSAPSHDHSTSYSAPSHDYSSSFTSHHH